MLKWIAFGRGFDSPRLHHENGNLLILGRFLFF
jgi:hypothetical protein